MDALLKQELTQAGLRLREAISRVVNEAPECLSNRNDKWFFEFRTATTGESIVVTYVGPKVVGEPS